MSTAASRSHDPFVYVLTAAPGSVRVRAAENVVKPAPALGAETSMRLAPMVDVPRSTALVEVHQELELVPGDHGELGTVHDAEEVGVVRGFSRRSRSRMMYRLSTLDFTEMPGIAEMVTLTYGDAWPADGRIVKAHLHAFAEAWSRKWGERPSGVWKLEFQRRGAPHFHLYVGRPSVPWREFLDWARSTWHRIAYECIDGNCEHAHRAQGVRLDRQFVAAVRSKGKIAGYFAKHNSKGSKSYQNQVPEGFENVGRFWGVWGLDVHEQEIELSQQAFIDARRALVRLRRSKMAKRRADGKRWRVRCPGRLIGVWAMCADGYMVVATLLSRDGPASSFLAWERSLGPPALVPV